MGASIRSYANFFGTRRGRFCIVGVMFRSAIIFAVLSFSSFAGTPDADWAGITKLDAGPSAVPKNEAEAKRIAIAHNELQQRTLRAFIDAHAKDEHFFEAKLRLARTLNIRARLGGDEESDEIARILEELEKIAVGPQRAELDFVRLSREMRRFQGKRPTGGERAALLDAARKFQRSNPADRRIAALLAEVATLFESDPKTKESLVGEAEKTAVEPDLKAQLADDRKRLRLVDKPLGLNFTGIDGTKFDIKAQRGKVVIVLFFATWSEPSREAFAELKEIVLKNEGTTWAAISLDREKTVLEGFLRQHKNKIAVGWDGKVWASPFVQTLGINSLPTVWIFDKAGVLRSLDGMDETEKQISALSGE